MCVFTIFLYILLQLVSPRRANPCRFIPCHGNLINNHYFEVNSHTFSSVSIRKLWKTGPLWQLSGHVRDVSSTAEKAFSVIVLQADGCLTTYIYTWCQPASPESPWRSYRYPIMPHGWINISGSRLHRFIIWFERRRNQNNSTTAEPAENCAALPFGPLCALIIRLALGTTVSTPRQSSCMRPRFWGRGVSGTTPP